MLTTVVTLVPLFVVIAWVAMIRDWYRHAVNRREFWLIVIVLTNVIGYALFLHSSDRSK